MDDFKCADCGKLPPQTESAYTLIGGKAGWRFTRNRAPDGSMQAEWRCPDCWAQFRKNAPAPVAAPGARTNAGPKPESMPPGRRKP